MPIGTPPISLSNLLHTRTIDGTCIQFSGPLRHADWWLV
jgi:hypothetical protein